MGTPTRIGDIISGRQEAPETSDSRAASKNSIITLTEAQEKGFSFKNPPPQPHKCQYCGKELQPQGAVINNVVYFWLPTIPRCDCKEATAYWQEHDRREKERKEAEAEAERRKAMREKISRLLGQSGIKKRFQQRTFPNFRCDTAGRKKSYAIAKEYADNFAYHKARGDGLYIEGTNGTGKTHLAAAIALQLIGEGTPVICKTSSDLLMDIRRSFDNREVNEAQILDIYKKVDLLIIDDLGKEQCSDWSMSTLYSILNDRYEDMKPTIITTNYNADGLINALTPKGFDNTKIIAIISRLRETSTLMTMAWEDIRGSV
ncbi:ATP-binding protein [Mediterraneibacter gnavus]|uniref:ATP-binding protein n=1 Tax=Mediterraneibacter gnavus TaxID=33038 RepID=UPI0015E123EE|nr:ATP-binding protein [Mediterraneibacter gnavus]